MPRIRLAQTVELEIGGGQFEVGAPSRAAQDTAFSNEMTRPQARHSAVAFGPMKREPIRCWVQG